MPILLLVEGKQDVEFITQFIKRAALGTCRSHPTTDTADFVVKSAGSYEQLRADLPQELRNTNFTRFGVIPDADINPATRWQSLSTRLMEIEERSTRFFQDLPPTPDPEGSILRTQTGRTIGVWLWPDNNSAGDLESFAGQLTPTGDRLWGHATGTLENLPEKRYRDQHRHKALIHTWLAWQDPPGQSLGIAVAKGNLRLDTDSATRFRSFLTKLKEDPQ